MAVLPAILLADPPPDIPAWHNGDIVFFTVNPATVGGPGVDGKDKFYNFNGGQPGGPQFDVLAIIPGEPGFNPLWDVIAVFVLDGRNVSMNPFKSEAEILAAQAAGKVALVDTGFSFLCPVITRK
jgi:hypothetical protein